MSVDDRLREELGALLDGELAPEREAELRARIEREPELARELEALRRTVAAVRGLGRETAPAALRERLARPRPARIVAPRWWLAAAAVLLVAVGAALLAKLGDEPPAKRDSYEEATLPDEEPASGAEKTEDALAGNADGDGQAGAPRGSTEAMTLRETDAEESPAGKLGADAGGRAQRPPADDRAEAEPLERAADESASEPKPEPKPKLEKESAGTPPVEQSGSKAATARRRDTADALDKDEEDDEARHASVLATLSREGRLAPDRRRAYFAALADLEPARFVDHVAGLPEIRVRAPAPTAPKGPAAKNEVKKAKAAAAAGALAAKSAEPGPLEVRMADRAEALALAKLLRAGFPMRKKSARGASTSLEMSRKGQLDVDVELTAREREQVRNWLTLIDATRAPDAPFAIIQKREAPGAGAGGAGAETKARRESVRVRIRFPN